MAHGLLPTCQLHQKAGAAVGTLAEPTDVTGVRALQQAMRYLIKSSDGGLQLDLPSSLLASVNVCLSKARRT